VPPALLRCHVAVDSSCPNIRATESHNNWTNLFNSGQGIGSAAMIPEVVTGRDSDWTCRLRLTL
jgi:hypothetical protein